MGYKPLSWGKWCSMAKRGGRNRNKPNNNITSGFGGRGMWWETATYNTRLVEYYRNIIMQLAMSRFNWVNLPKTCDARFLEYTLLTAGVATIAFPPTMKGTFFSTKAKFQSTLDVYDNPFQWQSIGNNGWRFNCSPFNGVLIRDNSTRFPLMEGINLYARELAQIRITKNVNRFHQKMPVVYVVPQERKLDTINMIKQVAGGEPAVMAYPEFARDVQATAMQTGVPYLSEQIAQDEINVWNRIYMMLGIDNSTLKMERQTQDEIQAHKNPAELIRLSSLNERRCAADYLNRMFPEYLLDGDIKVEWNRDLESNNFNFTYDMRAQAELLPDLIDVETEGEYEL